MGWFEKEKGSDEWWIRYADQYGHIRREKVGSKSLAKKVYQKRKTEIRENRFFSRETRPQKGYALRRYEQALFGESLQG